MLKPSLLTLAAALAFTPALSAQTKIALTFDDLPSHSTLPPGETRMGVAQQIIAALQAAHVPPVYGFVNAIRMQEQPDTVHVLEAWRAAGFPLGNHTWSHMNLNDHTPEDWGADLLRDEPALQQQFPKGDWHWLRFPYLAEGNTPAKQNAARAFLHDHGYRIAGVTMSFSDYAYNEPFARCSAAGNTAAIAQIEQQYLAGAEASLKQSHEMSVALAGHDIPYVLLMHLGAFDARMLPRLLALYAQHGVTFITLEEAERDPFYRVDVDLSLPYAPDSLEGQMAARKLPLPKNDGPSLAALDKLCR